MEKVNVTYDRENDVLFLYKNVRPKGSIELGDFILSFTEGMKATGIEILNASKRLSQIFDVKLTKENLANTVKANFRTGYEADCVYVFFTVVWKHQQTEQKGSSMIPVPQAIRA